MEPQRAGVYCRLSYAPDGSLEKVERQEADCRQLAGRLSWHIGQVYSDNSRSAWQRNRKRPAWDRMLADIEAGRIDSIIVYHGDRLIRQPWDLELLLKLADDKRLPLASVSGTRDLNNEDDRFILRIEAAQACKSSADTSRRVTRGWQARAERGESIGGGKRPFGFGLPTGRTGKTGKPIYDVNQQVPEEAAVLRGAVERLLAGQTIGGVLAWMNEESTTTEGGRWLNRGLRRLLLSPRIAGFVEHDGKLHAAVWEPIITREQWEDVAALLDRRAASYVQVGRERRYLLSGVAECSGCGESLYTKSTSGRRNRDYRARIYSCRNTQCERPVSRNVEHLDAYVEGRVLRLLNDRRFIDSVHGEHATPGVGAEIAALRRRRAEAKQQLENLADHPDVSPSLVAQSLTSFDRKIAALREQQEATTRDRLLARMAGMTREQWGGEPIDVRAETVRALFKVVVLPATWRGPGFDPESVDMRRR